MDVIFRRLAESKDEAHTTQFKKQMILKVRK